eukprot:TRINITY_DN7626_c0_g1_i1.p1 TRINITY_DN7626_c0_g1~~TRINITY_DN7626_c0_g1_i1.p1  ORF type:complete len:85 (-),score=10.19 TRINITY_DN7626_c0_g1_i1:462-716(-)
MEPKQLNSFEEFVFKPSILLFLDAFHHLDKFIVFVYHDHTFFLLLRFSNLYGNFNIIVLIVFVVFFQYESHSIYNNTINHSAIK